MDEGTIKTPIPTCRRYWCFCLGWFSNFVGSKSGQSLTPAEYGLQHNSTPPPHSHTLPVCIYCTFTLGRWGVGEVREKVEGQEFTRGVENTNMTDCISSL
jgi:hypothetical protein